MESGNHEFSADVLLRSVEMSFEGAVLDIAREAIYTIIITATPLLLVSLVIGLVVSIFQTVTSIQEQTLTFVPKIIGVFLTMMLGGSWMLNNMSGFMTDLWSRFSYFLSLL